MERALFWAERGHGRTSPNPIVGAVVTLIYLMAFVPQIVLFLPNALM